MGGLLSADSPVQYLKFVHNQKNPKKYCLDKCISSKLDSNNSIRHPKFLPDFLIKKNKIFDKFTCEIVKKDLLKKRGLPGLPSETLAQYLLFHYISQTPKRHLLRKWVSWRLAPNGKLQHLLFADIYSKIIFFIWTHWRTQKSQARFFLKKWVPEGLVLKSSIHHLQFVHSF